MGELKRDGHRKRVKDTYLENPEIIKSMSDHNMLEMLLFFSIPRRDVKEISYALMNHFGTLENIFNASPYELMEVDGVGENSAILISLIKQFDERIKRNHNQNVKKIDNCNALGKYVFNLLSGNQVESVILICLDNDLNIIKTHYIGSGTVNHVHIEPSEIVKCALNDKAASVVLAHNHPRGECFASAEDVNFTVKMLNMLRDLGIDFIDHVIVNEEKFMCMSGDIRYANYFDNNKF